MTFYDGSIMAEGTPHQRVADVPERLTAASPGD
jgi:hypothetical protein